MAKKNSSISTNKFLTALVYAVIGILLLVLRSQSLSILMTIVGVVFIVLGIVDVLKKDGLIKGVIEIAIGAAIIICGWVIVDIVLLVFGILLAVKGVIDLFKNIKGGIVSLLSPILSIVIGVLLIFARGTLIDTMIIIVGILFIINAVLVLFGKKTI